MGQGQFFCSSGRISHLWFGFGFGKFTLKIPNFSIFSLRVKKYPGQRHVGLLSTASQKYALVGSGPISTLRIFLTNPSLYLTSSFLFQAIFFLLLTQAFGGLQNQLVQQISSDETCINVKKQETTNSCKTLEEVVCSPPKKPDCQEGIVNRCHRPLGYLSPILLPALLDCEESVTSICETSTTNNQTCKGVEKTVCEPMTQLVPKVICGKIIIPSKSSEKATKITTNLLSKSVETTTQPFRLEDQADLIQPYFQTTFQDPRNLQFNTFWSHFKDLIRNTNHLEKTDSTKHEKDQNYEPTDIKKFIFNSTESSKSIN